MLREDTPNRPNFSVLGLKWVLLFMDLTARVSSQVKNMSRTKLQNHTPLCDTSAKLMFDVFGLFSAHFQ